jgi:hypothetical protein
MDNIRNTLDADTNELEVFNVDEDEPEDFCEEITAQP